MNTAASDDKPMKIGVQLPEVEREVRWPELASMARLAEDNARETTSVDG